MARCISGSLPSSRVPPRHRYPARPAGVRAADPEDLLLRRHRRATRCRGVDRRGADEPRWRVRRRLLLPADGAQGRQQDARLPGGDFRAGPAVTTFTDDAEALAIANDTLYGLGAGVWTRDGTRAYKMGRAIKAGRVWTNCYHQYPAGAAFGGYKISGIGRENHRMMLDHYSETKNLLVSYSTKPLGLFSVPDVRHSATPADHGHPGGAQAITRLLADRGAPVMFVQSGGCCAGSTPMCFPRFLASHIDVNSVTSRCPFHRGPTGWIRVPSSLAAGARASKRRAVRPCPETAGLAQPCTGHPRDGSGHASHRKQPARAAKAR